MSSTNKNRTQSKFKAAVIGRRVEPSTEDRAVWRLLIIIGVTVAAILLLILMRHVKVGNMTLMGWVYSNVYFWFRWVAVALFALSIVWFVYSKYFLERDETDSFVTTGTIVGCMAVLAFVSWYLYASDNYYPVLVMVSAAGVIGIMSQMVSPLFLRLAIVCGVGACGCWLAATSDLVLGNIILYAVAAFISAVFIALKISDGKHPADRSVRVPLVPAFIALAVLCVAAAVVSCFAAAALLYITIAFPVLLIASGIMCTVAKR